MRMCSNCFNGHYNLSDRGEEMYCDSNEFFEEYVIPDSCCDEHRYIPGYEEEKNILFFDNSYIAPGFLIVNKKMNEIDGFIKIFSRSNFGFPDLAIRAYKKNYKDEKMSFSLRDIEDYENGLYDIFTILCWKLENKITYSVDRKNHNNIMLIDHGCVTQIVMQKDPYINNDCFDLIIGDNYTCDNYEAFLEMYNALSLLNPKTIDDIEVKKILKLVNR